ncbi:gephyrin-like molybdotransferase Glp [Variovorax sp. H27-G14]|uniref:molybdopterin molybdotransferase MoeA n=1 Tax=Variovorax sp. H27-G14 TaxID=3111914 RepID=UPI0038FCFAFB
MADTPVPFSASSLRPPLMPLDEAIAVLLAKAQPTLPSESVATFDADGRVLAQDLVSGLTVPPRDNSAMDGYAVRVADCATPGASLVVAQRIPAGTVGTPLAAGTAARIFTGAQIPEGADAVVMQEDTTATPHEGGMGQPHEGSLGTVRIAIVPVAGQWVRRAGEDVASGDVVLKQGERLTPAALGLAASVGFHKLQVARKPRVAMLSTGDELVMPGEVAPDAMKPGAIYNSNRFFMRALLHRLGCEVNDLGIVPDNRDATIAALREAAETSDLIITTGGVSVGEEDHIRAALQALGELQLWSLSMKPGKPFAHGSIARSNGQGACHVTGLPGNPVSSFLTFLMLVRPFLLTLQGVERTAPEPVALRADFNWPRADKRREFLRVRRNAAGGLDLFANQSSGVLTSMVWGDGLVDNPAGQTIQAGDVVQFIPFASLLG